MKFCSRTFRCSHPCTIGCTTTIWKNTDLIPNTLVFIYSTHIHLNWILIWKHDAQPLFTHWFPALVLCIIHRQLHQCLQASRMLWREGHSRQKQWVFICLSGRKTFRNRVRNSFVTHTLINKPEAKGRKEDILWADEPTAGISLCSFSPWHFFPLSPSLLRLPGTKKELIDPSLVAPPGALA